MADFDIHIDPELCSGCSCCIMACPVNIEIQPSCAEGIAPKSNEVLLRAINGVCCVLNLNLCKEIDGECGVCEAVCPNGALKLIKK